ncbi:TlpA family protein disulfide reductase [Mucilaginibacter celer]|uniref:TlpA family protein disulfide reductase n=1 Tax=Mucilaginibacter celer TaxID=2305508 RepID=A0A494VRM2_9SPHI|nr:TlpA disulfide reductase family protein [Mucilaginibacter celer]AYL96030.1 TlpA family protein disulfide reductase [Mucilaginibacter celer]
MIQRKKISISNIISMLTIALLLLVIFKPEARSYLIRGLMAIGIFNPNPAGFASEEKNFSNIPDLQFKNTEGNLSSIQTLHNKVVFVNYWATWCPPCIAEMPTINQLYNKYRNDEHVKFIMVDVDGDLRKAKAFMDKNGYSLPLYTQTNAVPDSLMNGTIPTTLVFDKQGKLIFKHAGVADYSSKGFDEFIRLNR